MPHVTIADLAPQEILAKSGLGGFSDPDGPDSSPSRGYKRGSIGGEADPYSASRRIALARRFRIEAEDHKELLATRICDVYNSPNAKAEILKYVSKTINVQKRVTDEVVAPLYRWAPSRYIEGAKQTLSRDWAKILDESGIKTKAKQWARYAFIGGVVFIFPVVREYDKRKRLCLEMILPHECGVIWSDESDVDPETPSILVHAVRPYDVRDRFGQAVTVRYRAIDADGWWGLDKNGNTVERRAVWSHGIPPFVPFRLATPPPSDWWDSNRGDRLAEATLEAGRIQASMLWIRKEQQRKLLVLQAGSPDNVEEGGSATPEASINLWGDPSEVELKTLDYETKPDSFLKDIDHLIEVALESNGIPARAVHRIGDRGGESPSELSLSSDFSLISLVRDDMIGMAEQAEQDLAYKIALQVKAGRHPLAKRIKPDDVRESARVKFPPMTFADHPRARAEIYKSKIELGLMTHAQALMEEFPGRWASEEDAKAEVKRIVGDRNEIAEMLAIHNTPKDPTEDPDAADRALMPDEAEDGSGGAQFQTKAQAFGAQGGKSKNKNRVDAREE